MIAAWASVPVGPATRRMARSRTSPGRSSAAARRGRVRHHQVERGAQVRGQGLEPPPLDPVDPSRRPASSCQVGPGDLGASGGAFGPHLGALVLAHQREGDGAGTSSEIDGWDRSPRRRALGGACSTTISVSGRGISAERRASGRACGNPPPEDVLGMARRPPPLDHGVDGVDFTVSPARSASASHWASTPKPPRRCAMLGSVRPDVRWSRRRGPARTRPATPRQDVAASWSWRTRSSCINVGELIEIPGEDRLRTVEVSLMR